MEVVGLAARCPGQSQTLRTPVPPDTASLASRERRPALGRFRPAAPALREHGRSAERWPGLHGAAAAPAASPTPACGAGGPCSAPARAQPLGAAGRRALPHHLHLLVLTRRPPQLAPAASCRPFRFSWSGPCFPTFAHPGGARRVGESRGTGRKPPPQPRPGALSFLRPLPLPWICSLLSLHPD